MIDVISFPIGEQETSLAFMRGDDTVEVYTSDSTMITKLSKVTDDIEVLTADVNGRTTSAKFTIDFAQLSFRKKSKPLNEAQQIAIKKAQLARQESRRANEK